MQRAHNQQPVTERDVKALDQTFYHDGEHNADLTDDVWFRIRSLFIIRDRNEHYVQRR